MVFSKLKGLFTSPDEKYETLYYKYSQVKLENSELKKKHEEQLDQYKSGANKKAAMDLIKLYGDIEDIKNDSFKVKAHDQDTQKLLIGINKAEKTLRDIMTEMELEEISAKERTFDKELHEVASYEPAKGVQAGVIMKTVKKGFKWRGEVIKKPRVVVAK